VAIFSSLVTPCCGGISYGDITVYGQDYTLLNGDTAGEILVYVGTLEIYGGEVAGPIGVEGPDASVNIYGTDFNYAYGSAKINGIVTGILSDGTLFSCTIDCAEGQVVTLIQAGGPAEITVDIEVPCSLNINGHGLIPVRIFGTETFDVGDIDPSTLCFNGLAVRVKGSGAYQCSTDDINSDGWGDLVCHFVDDPTLWVPGQTQATVSGVLWDEVTEITGTAPINVVNEPAPE